MIRSERRRFRLQGRAVASVLGLLLAGCGSTAASVNRDVRWFRTSLAGAATASDQQLGVDQELGYGGGFRGSLAVTPFSWLDVGGRGGLGFHTSGQLTQREPQRVEFDSVEAFGEGVVRLVLPVKSVSRPYIEAFYGAVDMDIDRKNFGFPLEGDEDETGTTFGGQIGVMQDLGDDTYIGFGVEYRRFDVDSDVIGDIGSTQFSLILEYGLRF